MKSVVKSLNVEEKQHLPFPKLMVAEDTKIIVLFAEADKGCVVSSGTSSAWEVGEYGDGWVMSYFKDLPEDVEITLSNKSPSED